MVLNWTLLPVKQKAGGTRTPFTVSQMAFFRDVISKAYFFCKLLQDISKKKFQKPPGGYREK